MVPVGSQNNRSVEYGCRSVWSKPGESRNTSSSFRTTVSNLLCGVSKKFVGIGGRTIVELGTSRSFVSGGREGCMMNDARYWTPDQPDNWNWGRACSRGCAAEQLQGCRPPIHTVDISRDALEISRVITADFAGMIHYHLTSSEDFLQSFQGPIDLLYMDAGETGAGANQLHWRKARIALARQLFSPQAIVLIDDVNVPGVASLQGQVLDSAALPAWVPDHHVGLSGGCCSGRISRSPACHT